MGLANLLSVLGVLVVARQFARRRGLSSKTALKFTAASSALFFLLLIVLAVTTHVLH